MKASRRATRAFKTRACRYCAECDQEKLKRGLKPCKKKEIRHGACVNFRPLKKGVATRRQRGAQQRKVS